MRKKKGNKKVHSTVKNHHNYFKPLLKDILFLTAETVLLPVSSEMLNCLLQDIMVSLRRGLK